MTSSQHVYEVRPRRDKRGVDLISDVLPFGRLWYGEPDAISNAVNYAEFFSQSHDAVIRVYDEADNVIELSSERSISYLFSRRRPQVEVDTRLLSTHFYIGREFDGAACDNAHFIKTRWQFGEQILAVAAGDGCDWGTRFTFPLATNLSTLERPTIGSQNRSLERGQPSPEHWRKRWIIVAKVSPSLRQCGWGENECPRKKKHNNKSSCRCRLKCLQVSADA
jgi:hypothetical protein